MTSESDSVRMRADEVRAMAEESRIKGAEILNIFEHALDGYVMKTSENMSAGLVSELRQDPRVALCRTGSESPCVRSRQFQLE